MDENYSPSDCLVGSETAGHVNESEHDLNIYWLIPNISKLPKYISSNVHSMGIDCSLLWKVEVYLEKKSRGEKEGINLTAKLHRIDQLESIVRGTVEVVLADNQNDNLNSCLYSIVFPTSSISPPAILSTTLWSPRLWSVADDEMTLCINLKTDDCCPVLNRIRPTPNIQHRLVRDMQSALGEHLLADVVFASEDENIYANRFVLQMRSPCFNHLCQNDTVKIQNKTGKYIEAFKRFISYLYTGIVGDMSVDIARDLYVIALQYQANDLNRSCSTILISKITCESVCDILKLAYDHKDVYMKEAAMRFLSTNYSEVVFLPEWKKLIVADSLLHAEMTHYCIMQRTLKS